MQRDAIRIGASPLRMTSRPAVASGLDDELLVVAATDRDLALLLELADGADDALLRLLHLREAYGAQQLDLVEQVLCGALAELRGRDEEQGTDLALALTETLLARELTVVTEADVVQRVLAVAPGATTATVRLHPSVAGSVDAKELVDAGLVIIADAGLDRADAVVECDGALTDLRIGAAVDRLREVLR